MRGAAASPIHNTTMRETKPTDLGALEEHAEARCDKQDGEVGPERALRVARGRGGGGRAAAADNVAGNA